MQTLQERVIKALEPIRGYLQADGGDVRVHRITPEAAVEIELLGNCTQCNMSHFTMKAGIEQAILKAVPEVTKVYTVNLTE